MLALSRIWWPCNRVAVGQNEVAKCPAKEWGSSWSTVFWLAFMANRKFFRFLISYNYFILAFSICMSQGWCRWVLFKIQRQKGMFYVGWSLQQAILNAVCMPVAGPSALHELITLLILTLTLWSRICFCPSYIEATESLRKVDNLPKVTWLVDLVLNCTADPNPSTQVGWIYSFWKVILVNILLLGNLYLAW